MKMPGPAELAHLVPDRVVVLARLGQLAQLLGLVARGEELLRGALDRALVVGEVEVHRELGHPEHSLGDDVLEDLGRAALDRVRAGAQEAVGPRLVDQRRLGAAISIDASVSDWLMSDHAHFRAIPRARAGPSS